MTDNVFNPLEHSQMPTAVFFFLFSRVYQTGLMPPSMAALFSVLEFK